MLSFGEGQHGLILIGFGGLRCSHRHWARVLRAIGCRSRVAAELKSVRNVKPLLGKFGTVLGTMLGGIEMWMRTLKIGLPYTLKHGKADYAALKKAADCKPIDYPKPDGEVSFDKLSSVFLAATNHEEDQPAHLKTQQQSSPVQ